MSESQRCYQVGFGNHLATEAVPGALPVGRASGMDSHESAVEKPRPA